MGEDEATDSITIRPIEVTDEREPIPLRWKLDPAVLDRIWRELRDHYDEALREPIPQRLLALIDQKVARRVFH
jgi:hypothetical protein